MNLCIRALYNSELPVAMISLINPYILPYSTGVFVSSSELGPPPTPPTENVFGPKEGKGQHSLGGEGVQQGVPIPTTRKKA